MKARLLMICMLLLTTACGFHLRGTQVAETGISSSSIYIHSVNAPRLAREVATQISATGVTLANTPESASYRVTLKEENFEKSVLSVAADTGKVEEYQIVYNARIDAVDADGHNIIDNNPVSVARDFTFDENEVLGKFSEEGIVEDDLIRIAASQVLRRLQALLPTIK